MENIMKGLWKKIFGKNSIVTNQQIELNHQNKIKKIEEEAKESSIMYSNMLTGLIDAVIIIDTENIVTLFNPAAENLWGYSADEVIGKNVKMLKC